MRSSVVPAEAVVLTMMIPTLRGMGDVEEDMGNDNWGINVCVCIVGGGGGGVSMGSGQSRALVGIIGAIYTVETAG